MWSGSWVRNSAGQEAVDGKIEEELVASAIAGEEEVQGAYGQHQ